MKAAKTREQERGTKRCSTPGALETSRQSRCSQKAAGKEGVERLGKDEKSDGEPVRNVGAKRKGLIKAGIAGKAWGEGRGDGSAPGTSSEERGGRSSALSG